jgi:hypothetical protein
MIRFERHEFDESDLLLRRGRFIASGWVYPHSWKIFRKY